MKIYFAIGSNIKLHSRILMGVEAKRVLYSYAYVAGAEIVHMPFEDIMLDSGAFSMATGVEKVTLGGYSLWLQLYLSTYPQIKTYVNLDDLEDPKKSLDNLHKLEADGLSPMPVYHYGEDSQILDDYCSKYEYVGLGGFAVGNMPTVNMKKFWEWVAGRYKDNRFHIFGVGTMKPFYSVQPYSMDSTSWIWAVIKPSIAGYKDGLPDVLHIDRNGTGWDFLITREEILSMTARAMIDWEKCEWTVNVDENGNRSMHGLNRTYKDQARLF